MITTTMWAPVPVPCDGETVRSYNARHGVTAWGRTAWAIVGMTYAGDVFCARCVDSWPTYEGASELDADLPYPVFASDDVDGMTCGSCFSAVY